MTALFSYSTADDLVHRTPWHAWTNHSALNPDYVEEVSDVMDLGTAVHAYVLEGESAFVLVDAPDWRTKAAREQRDAARLAGQTPLLVSQWMKVQAMERAIRAQLAPFTPEPFAFAGGIAEHSLYWTENGVECRATPDWVSLDNRWIFDLKTTGASAHPAGFSRTLWEKGYGLQAALYRRGVFATTGVWPEFAFVVVETEPPYALSVVGLDPEGLAFENARLDYALELWARCLARNEWPGYPTRTCYAEVPAYLQTQFLERKYYEEAMG